MHPKAAGGIPLLLWLLGTCCSAGRKRGLSSPAHCVLVLRATYRH